MRHAWFLMYRRQPRLGFGPCGFPASGPWTFRGKKAVRQAWVARIGANRASPGSLLIPRLTTLYYQSVVVWSERLGLALSGPARW